MITLVSHEEIWPDAMVVTFDQPEPQPEPWASDLYDHDPACGHFHYPTEQCPVPGGPCGRYDCCIN